MAFKPTRNQTIGVQPLGVVPSTGLRDMSNVLNKMSQNFDIMRQQDRQTLFNEAVLEAELAGKTAVKFEDGKVKPITSMEYNPDMF